MGNNNSSTESPKTPKRFRVARPTLIFDHFMNYFIKVGGIAVIAAIAGIFIFILSQILPLFRAPSVEYVGSFPISKVEIKAIAVDEWSELPMFVDRQGRISFVDLSDRDESESRGMFSLAPDFSESDPEFTFVRYNQDRSDLLLGTDDGRFTAVRISYQATHPAGERRLVVPSLTPTPITEIGVPGQPFELFDYVDAGRIKLAVAVQREDGAARVNALVLRQRQTLLGPGALEVDKSFDLTGLFPGEPTNIHLTGEGDFLIVSTAEGFLHLLARDDDGFSLRQSLAPFEDVENQEIHSINFLSGNISLVLTNGDGVARMFSIYHDSVSGIRILGKTKDFEPLPSGATFFSPSLRNKGFIFGTEDFASLRFATTAQTRWESELDYQVKRVVLGGRYDKILMLDDNNTLHLYDLRDRHPQAGWAAYFGKIHYEGRADPEYVWQSTGGSDAFEPKISMVPLIIGTVKGTIYAMLFAIPISLLCAIYTSQFLPSRIRRTVKPAMEIMESVPTVVLGFK